MQKFPAIKYFVQQTLGCSCPEEVFEKIDYQQVPAERPYHRVCVGDQLLVYIVELENGFDPKDTLISALKAGVAERDLNGLNRFRLVLASAQAPELRQIAEQVFRESEYYDSKTHLHIVNEKDVEFLA